MCGYCTERAVIEHRLLEPEEPLDPFFESVYMQDAPDWTSHIRALGGASSPVMAATVICRWWDDLQGGKESMDVTELRSLLGSSSPIEDALQEPLAVPDARQILKAYCAANLDGSPGGWSDQELVENFASVYRALLVVAQGAPIDNVIVKIALSMPNVTPAFAALDLWLKRRALRVCVQRDPTTFLVDNGNAIRLVELAALLLIDAIPSLCLQEVGRLLVRSDLCGEGFMDESIEAISKLAAKRAASM